MEELKEQLNRIERYARLAALKVINIKDAALMTGLSVSHLYHLCSTHDIPHYKQGSIYFKRDELERWMTANRIASNSEIASKAELYTRTHRI